jgi:hydroxypyruvate isomerase
MRRREFVTALAAVPLASAQEAPRIERKGRLKQCVTAGVFARGTPFEDTCREAARLGCKGYDLRGPADWPTLKKYGLIPTMYQGPGGTIPEALNRIENHDRLEKTMNAGIDEAAANGVPNIITFSGNRKNTSDAEGADNCVKFLNKVKAHAEDKGVTICMELLNSKVNHKDYMCDHTAWGVEVMKRVGSPRVKLLYDIYHLQIMEGDICRTIKDNIQYLGHFHTGGNPGRHEIDDTQELNYRFVAKTIADLGYTGYVAHEYSPAQGRDPIQSLNQAMEIFDV